MNESSASLKPLPTQPYSSLEEEPMLSAGERLHNTEDLRRLIAKHLPKNDLLRCMRVSNGWLETGAKIIWREVSVQTFLDLVDTLPVQPEARKDESLLGPTVYYRNVRSIRHEAGLSSTFPLARLLLRHHPNLLQIKGSYWAINATERSISCQRSADAQSSYRVIGPTKKLPGFKIIENIRLTFGNNYDCGPAYSQDDGPVRDLEPTLSSYVTPDTACDAGYDGRITVLDVQFRDDQIFKHKFGLWEKIPLLRHLSEITVRSSGTAFQVDDLKHMLRNTGITSFQLDARESAISMSHFLDIVMAVSQSPGSKNLVFTADLGNTNRDVTRALLEQSRDFRLVNAQSSEEGGLKSSAPRRIRIRCYYNIPWIFNENRDVRQHLSELAQNLYSLSELLTIEFST